MKTKDHTVKFVSVVIPVYNEEGSLKELFDRVLGVLDALKCPSELILVDDGSQDSSADLIREACSRHPGKIVGCILNRNYGQHAAVIAGFEQSQGDLIITLDADLQNPPEEIPRLIAAAEEGFDVVGTVRQNRRDTLFRRVSSKLVNFLARKATGMPISDCGCMLRAYRRFIVDAMLKCHEHSTFIPLLANSFSRRCCEIPVAHAERKAGESKYSFWKLVNLQFNLLTCMTTLPLRILTWFGLFTGMCGVLLSFYILLRRFGFADGKTWSNGGTFTLFAILFIFTGVQMFGIGMIGEYLGRLYNDVRNRPRYLVEEVSGRTTKGNE